MNQTEIYRLLYIEAGEGLHCIRHKGSLTGQKIEDCDIQCCAEVVRAKRQEPQETWTLTRVFGVKRGNPTSPYARRMTEFVAYCPKHIGIGFPSYHIGYEVEDGKRERLYECSVCHHEFTEPHGMECDTR